MTLALTPMVDDGPYDEKQGGAEGQLDNSRRHQAPPAPEHEDQPFDQLHPPTSIDCDEQPFDSMSLTDDEEKKASIHDMDDEEILETRDPQQYAHGDEEAENETFPGRQTASPLASCAMFGEVSIFRDFFLAAFSDGYNGVSVLPVLSVTA